MTQELRRLAEAATQGEWSAKRWTDEEGDVYGWKFTVNGYLLPLCNLETDNNDECDANAAYIAAANPTTILSLLDRLEKAEKEPEVTSSMIEAAEQVEDLYRRGTPDTWGKVFRAMWRAMEASK